MPEATQIQLGAERDIGLYELALASAKAGALGGAVGNVPRAMGSYEDWLRGVESDPLVFRGLQSAVDNPLAPRPGYAAFASNNPATALSYAGDPTPLDAWGRLDPNTGGPGAAVHPIRLSPDKWRGSPHFGDYSWLAKRGGNYDMVSFDNATRLAVPGQATVVRDVYDPGPRSTRQGGRAAGFRQDSYGWKHPEGLASPASAPMSPDEVAGLMHRSAERAGLEGGRFSGDSGPTRTRGTAEWPEGESFTNEELKRVLEEVPNDPRFKPSIRAKAAQFLKGAAKDAFSLKNILTDAGIGSLVGLASTVGTYEAYRPRTGGMFTAPGPGYEDALSKKDILEIAARKEAENDARRLAGIEEVNEVYGPGTLGPNARMSEIADYLGPIR